MTKSTITREQRINEVKELIANAEEWAGYYEHPIHDKPQREIFEGMARVMAEHLAALTAMDSEPVALQPELAKVIYHFRDWNEGFPVERFKADYVISWMLANYPPAPPAPVVPAVSDDIGEIRVGRLPTMNQDDYPGLGDWWVQLRIGEDSDEVLARVYGATPQEANNRAEALACRAAMLSGGKS